MLRLMIFLLLSGCVSTPKRNVPQDLPPVVDNIFQSCSKLDGSANVQVYKEKDFLGAVDVDWAANPKGWRTQVLDPVARTLLDLAFDEPSGSFSIAGPLSERVPPLATENGYITIDGHMIALSPTELPCYWAGFMPRAELLALVSFEKIKEGYTWQSASNERTMLSTLKFISKDQDSYELCSTIIWSRLFGLIQRNIVICTKKAEQLSGHIDVLNKYHVQWTSLDELE